MPPSHDELSFLAEHLARKRRRRDRLRRRHRAGAVLGAAALGVVVVLLAGGFTAGETILSSCSLSSLRAVNIGANTFVYAADGSLLGSIPAERNREPITMSQMTPWLPRATIAIEDRRFYQHGGIDYVGIARAALRDINAGKAVQGGSTITQQLVRNLYTGREKTFDRKIKEACLAIKLADKWPKNRILTAYLNTVFYGNHAYGVEAAAQTYFSKDAKHLTLAEAALLAGLPQAPTDYDPFHDRPAAIARRSEVLAAMLKAQAITPAQYRQANHAPLVLHPGEIYQRIKEPYFFSYVEDELTAKYGANTVREGGLRVYTTIEPRLQRDAIKAIKSILYEKTDPASAIVSVEPGTGAIRAMTAVSPGNAKNQFNFAAQSARQAGSTFKTFVLASAIEKGIDPDTTYYTSAPFTCTTGPWCAGDYAAGKPWTVTTYDHTYAGSISITQATLRSDNTVYAQLTLDVGPYYVWNMARRLGVNLTQKPVASIGLGALAVSPLEMAAAYATFASGGIYAKPTGITKVVLPDGKTDTSAGWGKWQTKRALSPAVAWKVTQILSENAMYGTGAGSGDGVHPNAGKTGTTENWADAWFDGYTRDLSTVVWMGYPRGEIPMTDVHGQEVAGATFPVPIWHAYMAAAEWRQPVRQFLTPPTQPVYRPFTKGYWGYTYNPQPVYTPSPSPSPAPAPAPTSVYAPTTSVHFSPVNPSLPPAGAAR